MQVRDVMTPNPYGVQTQDSVQHATQMMRTHGVGSLLVFRDNAIAGIITDRDVATECVAGGHDPRCEVREHMTADPISISTDASADEALRLMGDAQVRRLCVTDNDRVAGIVTLGDLAVRMSDSPELGRVLADISQPVRVQI